MANGRSPQAPCRHLSILEEHGLIMQEGGPHGAPSTARGRSAARYRLAGPLRFVGADDRFAAEYATCVDRVLRDAARWYRRPRQDDVRLLAGRLRLLTDREAADLLRRVRALVDELRAQSRKHPDAGQRRPYSVLLGFAEADLRGGGHTDDDRSHFR